MGKTSIEWTDASWNPIVGCTEISPGCANCYAARLAATRLKNHSDYKALAVIHEGRYVSKDRPNVNCSHWEGEVRFLCERLEEPLHWKKPRKIFVCDMGDLFHESVDAVDIARIFLVMQKACWHTFQVLTKRADRMHHFFTRLSTGGAIGVPIGPKLELNWPLPNVWVGVSVENQHFADDRIPILLDTPAAVRFISAEPLLGAVELKASWLPARGAASGIDWVICGGESGPNARPMHPDWARSLRDQCVVAGVPFFFKQWGEWAPCANFPEAPLSASSLEKNHEHPMIKVGKKKAGRLLDGREWNEFPQVQA